MKSVLFAALLLVGMNGHAATFPIGKFECKTSTQNTIWVIKESADKLPWVVVTFVGTAGAMEREGIATINSQLDASGHVASQSLRFESGLLSFDASGVKNCTAL